MNKPTLVLSTALLALGGLPAMAQHSIENTQVVNTAIVFYTPPGQNEETEDPNTVTTKIDIPVQTCHFEITPNGTLEEPITIVTAQGPRTVLPYTVTNTGNSAVTVSLTPRLERIEGQDDSITLKVYSDQNNDGQFDAEAIESLALAAGESSQVLVEVTGNDKATDVFVNLVGSCAGEHKQGPDRDNIYQIHRSKDIEVTKKADVEQVDIGDQIKFTLTITNTSDVPLPVEITDVLANPEALEYIKGSSTLTKDGKTVPFDDPIIKTQKLTDNIGDYLFGDTVQEVMTWQLPDQLPPKQTVTLGYAMRVEVGAAGLTTLKNNVMAGNDKTKDFDEAKVFVDKEGLFTLEGDLLGIVYVDQNRNGIFEKDTDTPLQHARVVLAGGQMSVTDKDGRYSFLNLPLGTHAVRLDPASVPYVPLERRQDGGLSGTQTVHVRGLTSADFPLAPLTGNVRVLRHTTLTSGPLTIHKVVSRTDNNSHTNDYNTNDYKVTLYLTTTRPITDFKLTDPLPQGAVLRQGVTEYQGSLNEPRTITYHFDFDGDERAAVTDPLLEWR